MHISVAGRNGTTARARAAAASRVRRSDDPAAWKSVSNLIPRKGAPVRLTGTHVIATNSARAIDLLHHAIDGLGVELTLSTRAGVPSGAYISSRTADARPHPIVVAGPTLDRR